MKKFDLAKAVKGKGLYIAIAACAIVVGGAGFIAYNHAVRDISSSVSADILPESSPDLEDEGDSDKPANSPVFPADPPDLEQGASFGIDETVQTIVEAQPNFMPVPGERITQPFSNGDLVKSQTLGVWKTHDGVDIAAALGTEVKSMTGGTVTEVGQDPMWGYFITIDHGKGITGYYYNLAQAMAVKKGDKVDAGDVIGAVGDSAEGEIAEEAHLHFALKQNDEWIDPIEYINPSNK